MPRVRLASSFKAYTGGRTEFEVDAANVRQLIERLGERYPELAPHLEHGIAVAIDGVIYQDALLQPIGSDVMRLPMALWMALAIAAIGGTIGTSPTPRTPNGWLGTGFSTMMVSMNGRSEQTGMR